MPRLETRLSILVQIFLHDLAGGQPQTSSREDHGQIFSRANRTRRISQHLLHAHPDLGVDASPASRSNHSVIRKSNHGGRQISVNRDSVGCLLRLTPRRRTLSRTLRRRPVEIVEDCVPCSSDSIWDRAVVRGLNCLRRLSPCPIVGALPYLRLPKQRASCDRHNKTNKNDTAGISDRAHCNGDPEIPGYVPARPTQKSRLPQNLVA